MSKDFLDVQHELYVKLLEVYYKQQKTWDTNQMSSID